MTAEERHWWMVLVDAEALASVASGENILAWDHASSVARCTLRDRFGVNLDDFMPAARDTARTLAQQYWDKEAAIQKCLDENRQSRR